MGLSTLRPTTSSEPHDYTVPPSVASLLYRDHPTDTDKILANCYWEAIWLEGARSPLLDTLRKSVEGRQMVVLASSADSSASVSEQEFLPVSVLPGLLESSGAPDTRYGQLRGRLRDRVAEDLAQRLERYNGRLLVVVGANDVADLDRLYDALESSRVSDLRLLVVWPPNQELPRTPEAGVAVDFWKGSTAELTESLRHAHVPAAADLPRWSVLFGQKSLNLTARDVQRITKRFVLLCERDLITQDRMFMEDLQEFLEGSVTNWAAFTCGLPGPRSYRSKLGLSLLEELRSALMTLQKDSDALTMVLQLPSEPGAGLTTMLRSAAFQAARDGHPTLILRPDQVEVDMEELLAFVACD